MDSMPNLGLGKVNSICEGVTFMAIWPFSSNLCQTWYRFLHRAWKKYLDILKLLIVSNVFKVEKTQKKSQLLFLNDILILIAYGMHKICRVGYSFIWSYISPMASASATLHSRTNVTTKKTTIKIVYEKMTVPIRKSLKFWERNMKDFFFFFCVYFARRVVQCNFFALFIYSSYRKLDFLLLNVQSTNTIRFGIY